MQLSKAIPLPAFDTALLAAECDEIRTMIRVRCLVFAPLQVMHGNGNVIAILPAYRDPGTASHRARLAREVCGRITAVRVDGVVFLRWTDSTARFWFHDRDGTYEPACGNGLRCAARLLSDIGWFNDEAEVLTDNGPRRIRMERGEPIVSVGTPREYRALGQAMFFVYTDIPHVVVLRERLAEVDVSTEGARLAHDDALCRMVGHPAGVHVDFVAVMASRIGVRTYEIGVEDETKACGTGAAAAAYVVHRLGLHPMPVEVRMRGGTLLVSAEGTELLITGQVDYLLRPLVEEGECVTS
ncbi:diaminopimelate epimerase [Nocardia iowensis]|uniref:Diaminopimelate epimerase n=1 Tax=Nocardia iowensis TaxID=204891 RepID=A0ABX8RLH4_NOCIO|nr:diaminopimelate epimerase [Nocardia iowensis]QXN89779.1 diaminopimelate epimerase [Nocardia iowensis]